MDQQRRSPSIHLISVSSPARPVSTTPSPSYQQSQSPFRYVQISSPDPSPTLLSDFNPERKRTASPRRISRPSSPQNSPTTPLPRYAYPSPLLRQPTTATHLRGHRICSALRPWAPIILYALTSLIFVVAIAFYKTEVFALLDELSHWLQADPEFGYAVLGLLIFITTIPPFPLYSTLIILAGYTFGAWTGAVISYIAALTGALAVFIVSRTHFHECISRWLSCTPTLKRVVRAVEKRPKLLFLIRLAPYPYNVMNCLLAAAPTLSLRTYTVCTALSLFKVIIHTSMGASIHSFKDYHVGPDAKHDASHYLADIWTILGLVLCVGILVYLSIVARRAVDEELDDELSESSEERIAFLSQASYDIESSGTSAAGPQMTQSPFRIQPFSSPRPS